VGGKRGSPKTLEQGHALEPLRSRAAKKRQDVRAHAVTDGTRRTIGTQDVEAGLEVRQVIGKPVACRRPLAAAKAAPVECGEGEVVGRQSTRN